MVPHGSHVTHPASGLRTLQTPFFQLPKHLLQHETELGNEAGEGKGAEGVDAVHVLQDAFLLLLALEPWSTAPSKVKPILGYFRFLLRQSYRQQETAIWVARFE